MREIIYFDTSALAKWYLNEVRSNDVEKYIQEHGPVDISELTVVEMRSLLARRRRERHIDPKAEIRVFATFEEDIRQKFLILHPLPEGLVTGAVNLLSVHSEVPLKTLDVLHLVMAKEIQAEILATADRIMIAGAKAMGFSVAGFD
jgi:predicted nucleic acid-binding protein